MSLVVILIGFIMFNSVPTLTPPLAPASDVEGSVNHNTESDDENTQRCVEEMTCELAHVDLGGDQTNNQTACVINSAKL